MLHRKIMSKDITISRSPHDKKNPYFVANKEIFKQKLSIGAKLVVLYLLSLPDDWVVYPSQLAGVLDVGKNKIYRIVSELIKSGHMVKSVKRTEKGRICGFRYEIFETPDPSRKIDEKDPFTQKGEMVHNDCEPFTQKQDLVFGDLLSNNTLPCKKNISPTTNNPSTKKHISLVTAGAATLEKFFFEKIKERNPNVKEPDHAKWGKEFDLMISADARTPEEIKRVIEWSQADDFWHTNILSPAKLRKQFDAITVKMNASSVNSNSGNNKTYALAMKKKYPDALKCMVIDANGKYVINPNNSKEVPFSLPHVQFKECFVATFGGY